MVHLSFCLIENIGVIHCRMNPSSTTNMVNQSQLKRRGIQTKRSTHTCRKRRRRSLLAGRRGNWRRGVTGWRVETTRPGPIRMSTFKRKLLSVGFCTFLLIKRQYCALPWRYRELDYRCTLLLIQNCGLLWSYCQLQAIGLRLYIFLNTLYCISVNNCRQFCQYLCSSHSASFFI